MYLFGSRARKDNRPDSDIDIFVENNNELTLIPKELLIVNGGPIDAFWLPDVAGVACAVGDEDDRRLLCDYLALDEAIPISIDRVISLALDLPVLPILSAGRGG